MGSPSPQASADAPGAVRQPALLLLVSPLGARAVVAGLLVVLAAVAAAAVRLLWTCGGRLSPLQSSLLLPVAAARLPRYRL